MRIFAVASPGLEPVVAAEVRALPGVSDVRELPGGVEAEGDRALVWRATLRGRIEGFRSWQRQRGGSVVPMEVGS